MFGNINDLFKGKPVRHLKPKEYAKTIPGTRLWMEIWKKYPDLQDEMLAFQKRGYIWCSDKDQRITIALCQSRDCAKPCPARDCYIPEGKK